MNDRGFTLVSMVIAMILMAILLSAALPSIRGTRDLVKISTTKEEMKNLKRAIIGDPDFNPGGIFSFQGYEGDTGSLPAELKDLVTRPAGVDSWDKWKRVGWKGPYLDRSEDDVSQDAWGNAYYYKNVGQNWIIVSWGPDQEYDSAGNNTQIPDDYGTSDDFDADTEKIKIFDDDIAVSNMTIEKL